MADAPGGLILGTAQLTRRYGVANRSTALTHDEAVALVRKAVDTGIGGLDTAPVYGDAESVIGDAGVATPVFTKLAAGRRARDSLRGSLRRLRRERVDLVFLHEPDAIHDEAVLSEAAALVGGQAVALGASVYDERQFAACLADDRIAAVQAPVSAVDRRMTDDGLLAEAARVGVAVYARSVFLQGALLLPPDATPTHLAALRPVLEVLDELVVETGMSRPSLLMAHARDTTGVTGVIAGAETAAQVDANADAFATAALEPELRAALEDLPTVPPEVLDPRTWP